MGDEDITPIRGVTYIFFAKKNSGPQLTIIRFLPATAENIARIEKLIAQLPAK
jgi:hypothetical protein